MKSRWDDVKAGDVISADNHLNKLGRAVFGPNPPRPDFKFKQWPVKITSLTIDAEDTEDSGLYLCSVLVYKPDDDEGDRTDTGWDVLGYTGGDPTYILDARPLELEFAVGDFCVAFWYSQRKAFIPVSSSTTIPNGTTTNDILRWEADQSGSSSSGEGGGQWVIEPAPSEEGEWVLAVVEGVMQWREVKPFTCGDESSGS